VINRVQWKENAVSETVGFIIIFGIVISGIGLVSLYGYPALLNQQEEANIRNMEKTLIVLQTDINSLAFKNVPYQETAIQVSGGTLSVDSPDPLKNFKITGPSVDYEFRPGEIKFQTDTQDVIISLQNGAVVKWQVGGSTGGSTMLSPPRWYFDESTGTLVLTLVKIDADSQKVNTGIGTVMMRLDASDTPIDQPYPGGSTISVNYTDTGDYRSAWRNYFNENFGSTTTSSISIPNVQKLVVKTYNLTILSL
jgi:hypothetical protein